MKNKKKVCSCGRKILFKGTCGRKKKWKSDGEHYLCQRCYRDHRNSDFVKKHYSKKDIK